MSSLPEKYECLRTNAIIVMGKAIAAGVKGEELSEDELADVAGGEIIRATN